MEVDLSWEEQERIDEELARKMQEDEELAIRIQEEEDELLAKKLQWELEHEIHRPSESDDRSSSSASFVQEFESEEEEEEDEEEEEELEDRRELQGHEAPLDSPTTTRRRKQRRLGNKRYQSVSTTAEAEENEVQEIPGLINFLFAVEYSASPRFNVKPSKPATIPRIEDITYIELNYHIPHQNQQQHRQGASEILEPDESGRSQQSRAERNFLLQQQREREQQIRERREREREHQRQREQRNRTRQFMQQQQYAHAFFDANASSFFMPPPPPPPFPLRSIGIISRRFCSKLHRFFPIIIRPFGRIQTHRKEKI